MILNSEVEEGFLRSGAAKGAVPPVEMTDFGLWIMWEKRTPAKLAHSTRDALQGAGEL
jgi:hypothetical protein